MAKAGAPRDEKSITWARKSELKAPSFPIAAPATIPKETGEEAGTFDS